VVLREVRPGRRGPIPPIGTAARRAAPLALGLWLALSGAAFAEGSIRVRVAGGVDVVPLEVYVERTVASEIYPSWPMDALKAQAVVARTYALHERARNANLAYDVESSVVSQRYREGAVPARIRRAVAETRAEFLEYRGAPILAAFHASAGGRTASAEEVWGQPLAYLQAVSSPDDDSPDYFWSFEIARGDLLDALRSRGFPVGGGRPIEVAERSASGRVTRVRVGDAEVTGREFRRALGGRALRSTKFEVRVSDRDVVRFLGSGSGHGVGLCQWGARALADSGESYREILEHYYPGSRLRTGRGARALGAGVGR
jgi:stage II sporulation protein D